MKYLKRYNEIVNLSKLTNEELKNYEYIIGNGILNESFSTILDRLKTIGKKTLLTTTLLSSLMSNPAFSAEYNKLTNAEKTEIESLVSKGGPGISGPTSIVNTMNTDFINVELGGLFESGKYQIVTNDQSSINKLKDFINKNKGKKFVIKISASESRVPNRDAETGEKMAEKELAEKRYESTKKFIEDNLGTDISFVKDIKLGGPEYIGDDVKQDKYKKHQFVNATISLDIWDFNDDFVGVKASKENNYVGKSYKFLTENTKGTGTLQLSPGRIPDRAKTFINGVVVGDTGYFSDVAPDAGYKLIPLYVLELTKGLKESPNTEAFKNVEKIRIKSITELDKIILDSSVKTNTKFDRTELETAYGNLVSYVKETLRKDGYVDIVVYDIVKKDIKITINGEKSLEVEVYSPIGKTGFTVSIEMDGELNQRSYNQKYVTSNKDPKDNKIKFM
jgi:hypothetical protein